MEVDHRTKGDGSDSDSRVSAAERNRAAFEVGQAQLLQEAELDRDPPGWARESGSSWMHDFRILYLKFVPHAGLSLWWGRGRRPLGMMTCRGLFARGG